MKNFCVAMVDFRTHKLSEDPFEQGPPKKKRKTQKKYGPFCGKKCNREPNPLCAKNNPPSNGMLSSKRCKKQRSQVDKENFEWGEDGCVSTQNRSSVEPHLQGNKLVLVNFLKELINS